MRGRSIRCPVVGFTMQVRYGCVDDDVVLCIAKPIYQHRDGHECVFKKQRTHIIRTVLLFFDYVPNKQKKNATQ